MSRSSRPALAALALAGSLLVGASSAFADGATTTVMPAAGTVFACQNGTYTAVAGDLKFVMHDGASASGNQNVTGTVTPEGVVLRDGLGGRYRLAGAAWFGATYNAQTGSGQETDTAVFQILSSGGGTVASVQEVFHVGANGTVALDKGSCLPPM